MMEQLFDWTLRIAMALLTFFGVTVWNRQRKLEEDFHAMQLQCVTRTALQAEMATMRTDRLQMHEENKTDLRDLKTSIESVNTSLNLLAREVASLTPARRSRP